MPPSLLHHRGCVRVTLSDAAPDGGFDAVDGVIHGGKQLRPLGLVESVSVGDEP
jgi:hypothetical protein